MMDWISLAVGMGLGLSLAAPPGPMNAIIAEQSVLHGRRAGMFAGLGTMSADGLFCLGAFAGAIGLVQRAGWVRGVLFAIGGGLMLYFAYSILRETSGRFEFESADVRPTGGFFRTFLLALTNPYQIGWWLTAGVSLVQPQTLRVMGVTVRTPGGFQMLVGLFGGIGLWVVGFPTLLVYSRKRLRQLVPWVVGISALILAVFGGLFLAQAVTILVLRS